MKTKTMLALLGAIVMLTSCEELFGDDDLKPDGSNPSLVINTPSTNQTVNASQGLRINITGTDKDNITDIAFSVKGSEDEADLVKFSKFHDKRVVEFDTTVMLSDVKPGVYSLVIDAVDKRTNRTQREVMITVK
ncbi:Ig-like domain-containing protein [Pontibacter silvestris]|uniref:Ig-like domain-containing protein n=1 Tax=Pontibacter silvestris TaxID=2305183 RepID=A0ABW4WTG2_9BACT|nr:Ig-like domain-containing protein [Pontibacter silvestris]MCC9137842.1 Ig-like domain-containing protein [Pontibacter silvestris]